MHAFIYVYFSSALLLLVHEGVPTVRQSSISLCWLPALDTGGLNDFHYNIYLFNTSENNPIIIQQSQQRIMWYDRELKATFTMNCMQDINVQTSYGHVSEWSYWSSSDVSKCAWMKCKVTLLHSSYPQRRWSQQW